MGIKYPARSTRRSRNHWAKDLFSGLFLRYYSRPFDSWTRSQSSHIIGNSTVRIYVFHDVAMIPTTYIRPEYEKTMISQRLYSAYIQKNDGFAAPIFGLYSSLNIKILRRSESIFGLYTSLNTKIIHCSASIFGLYSSLNTKNLHCSESIFSLYTSLNTKDFSV
jgi:hypothetical protein